MVQFYARSLNVTRYVLFIGLASTQVPRYPINTGILGNKFGLFLYMYAVVVEPIPISLVIFHDCDI